MSKKVLIAEDEENIQQFSTYETIYRLIEKHFPKLIKVVEPKEIES